MSNLSNISYDKIENDIMIVLYSNIDTIFTQYSLFNKLISDKYDLKNSVSIHPNFKSKFNCQPFQFIRKQSRTGSLWV